MAYTQSIAKTNKLYCSHCRKRIKKGENVVFCLDDNLEFDEVYCEKCGEQFTEEICDDSLSPFDFLQENIY